MFISNWTRYCAFSPTFSTQFSFETFLKWLALQTALFTCVCRQMKTILKSWWSLFRPRNELQSPYFQKNFSKTKMRFLWEDEWKKERRRSFTRACSQIECLFSSLYFSISLDWTENPNRIISCTKILWVNHMRILYRKTDTKVMGFWEESTFAFFFNPFLVQKVWTIPFESMTYILEQNEISRATNITKDCLEKRRNILSLIPSSRSQFQAEGRVVLPSCNSTDTNWYGKIPYVGCFNSF